MKVLVVGGGGREHALAWKMASSPRVSRVYVAPGNAGTALEPKVENVPISATDLDRLLQFARDREIDLTVVGPEAPLVAGITDLFEREGFHCFGPCQKAARIEGSKVFAKTLMARYAIPTAEHRVFEDAEEAIGYLKEKGAPIVVKAEGLAAGKGVTVARSLDEAIGAVRACLEEKRFGDAGKRVVIEEFLEGEEASYMVVASGERYVPLATSQDHKPLLDGDRGPNTGGMGAYSPAPVITPEIEKKIQEKIIEPLLSGLAEEGMPYRGFLYAGLMITPEGDPYVLEFNCRLGDPETQPLMMRLQDDLAEVVLSTTHGEPSGELSWDRRAALGVVLVAEGYPGSYRKGDVIEGLPEQEEEDLRVFHAGTKLDEQGRITTAGGRVLCVTTLGETIRSAQKRAYEVAEKIYWPGRFFRRDIGWRAIER